MKEVFLILAHITDSLQENQLRNLVYKLKEENKSVFLATHTIPLKILLKNVIIIGLIQIMNLFPHIKQQVPGIMQLEIL